MFSNKSNTANEHINPIVFSVPQSIISDLLQKPLTGIISNQSGHSYKAKLVIPDYNKKINAHYKKELSQQNTNQSKNLPELPKHFGICITFSEPTEIILHNSDMELVESAKSLIKQFGALIIKNAYLDSEVRDMGHRNRFPQLNFHIDRNPKQDTRFSLYTRNPFDAEQVHPRTSMTVFIPYQVAYLQGLKEGQTNIADEDGLITRCDLYNPADIPDLLNSIILPHCWDEAEGTGEISIIDNANLLHASYYPDEAEKGYRIGVRYVS